MLLMSIHNICFYGELTKIILELSSNTHLICSTVMHFHPRLHALVEYGPCRPKHQGAGTIDRRV